jgi:hypothetical protein
MEEGMAELEDPDKPITLERAAAIAGVSTAALRRALLDEHLYGERPGRNWFTTRRHLHSYLMGRRHGKPLPEGYQAPESENP